MRFKLIYIFMLFLQLQTLSAESNTTTEQELSYIDKIHKILSDTILDYSNSIDIMLSNTLHKFDTNSTQDINGRATDSFFHSDKFLEETDETFVSVRVDSNFNSNGTHQSNISINARLPLSRSTKEFNFFINDLNQNNFNDLVNHNTIDKNTGTQIGVNYFAPIFHQINSKYSIGTNGINPFSIARYTINKSFYTWLIQPAQAFKYSLKDGFEEETKIYFDKQLTESRLFRIDIYRSSKADSSGMNYGLALQHFWLLKDNTGISLSQLFSGNTQYEYSTNNPLFPQETQRDNKITNYTTSLSYRKSVWRKWFFYGVTPNVNFQKSNNFETNYGISLFLDLHFGNIK